MIKMNEGLIIFDESLDFTEKQWEEIKDIEIRGDVLVGSLTLKKSFWWVWKEGISK